MSPLDPNVPFVATFSVVVIEPTVAVTVSLLIVILSVAAALATPSSIIVKVKLSVPV